MKKLRVLVVEDSLTVRRYLCDTLAADPGIEVVAEADDGKRAIELCEALRPDVVTLDMMLPVMTGLAATEYIMAYCPTPILVVSSSFNRGELFRTYEALAAGAVDVLDKPSGLAADGEWEARLVAAVKMVARIKVITHPRARLDGYVRRGPPTLTPVGLPVVAPPPVPDPAPSRPLLVALGASTGGPGALVDVLSALPARFSTPILIVLHIGTSFAHAFPEWLEGRTGRRVSYAREGEPVADVAGRVVLAPADFHLEVHGARLHLSHAPERWSCRPSVDVLFESLVASGHGPATIACLMTGMGRDGAEGLLALRRAGAVTIAQDEASSVIFGMPREAIALGAAQRVLPLGDIARALADATSAPVAGREVLR